MRKLRQNSPSASRPDALLLRGDRKLSEWKQTKPAFNLQRHLFPRQREFGVSQAKYRTACCSRRAGKSEACAAILFDVAMSRPGSACVYLTKTRKNAKRIIWGILKRLNREHNLGAKCGEADLAVLMPNGSIIYLVGANTKDEIDKVRGLPIAVVVVDEAQLITGYLKELIDEVLAPALMDYDGKVVLAGTPAPVPSGYFHECLKNEAWEHHFWTAFDNPWIEKKSGGKTPQQQMEEECRRRGVLAEDPSIQREWFGKWAYDPNALVFRYTAEANHYETIPSTPHGEWQCLLGVDLGWDDADAIVRLVWNTTLPQIWLAEESVLPKQTITQLGERLRRMVDAHNPLRTVVDFGGLGKKIAEELSQRWSLHVEAAEKERKLEHIELLNDALRTGYFKAKKDSRFAQDCLLVEWDKGNPEKWKISDRYHSDVLDASLYAYRRAKQWLFVPPPDAKPQLGTPQWHAAQAERMAKEAERIEAEWQRQGETLERQRKEANEDFDLLF